MKNSLLKRVIQDQKGSLLIGLIVVMTIFASMGAAMMSVTTTSTLGQIWTGASSQAYYLAESGFRYAETEYANTDDDDGDGEIKDDRNQKLKDWHSPDPPGAPVLFTFSDSKEKFELKIYPYYLVTSASYMKGVTSLTTEYAGEKPASFTVPSSGKLKIGTDPPYTYTGYNSTTGVCTISPGLVSNLSDNMDVYLAANPLSGESISKDGGLTLDDASFFPDYNGMFSIDRHDPKYEGTVYAYKYKDGNTLHDIFDVNDPDRSFLSVSVGSSTNIVLDPFFELHSIGIVDYGSSTEAKREIVYYIPVSSSRKREFVEKDWGATGATDSFPHWHDSEKGTHQVQSIGSDKALRVTGTTDLGSGDKGSLIGLDWATTSADLKLAHSRAGNFLSYDTQVKVGFDASVPGSYMAGLSFRQDAEDSLGTNAGNSYGVSFLKAGSSDGIPDDLCPDFDTNIIENVPLLVLWQQTNSGTDKKWLAYKDLIGRPVYLDTEKDGWNSWLAKKCINPGPCLIFNLAYYPPCVLSIYAGVLWHQESRNDRNGHTARYGYYGYYDKVPDGDYNTVPEANCGVIESPSIVLPPDTSPFLSFWSWYETESGTTYDKKLVQISTDGGTSWITLDQLAPPDEPLRIWQHISIDLSDPVDYTGKTIKIRFRFDTCDCVNNTLEGWYIDDVIIAEDFPINEATLMVRVKEAATLSFTGGGATPIEAGDIVYQATGRGTVLGIPILESGSWTVGGNATGIILLNKISGSFTAGQPLYVDGSALATTALGAGFYRPRDNYIRVYYGDKDGYGTPGTDALDYDKHGNPRGELHWPPDEVDDTDEDNDYFTLVGWDTDNTELDSVNGEGIFGKGKELDAIIRLNALTTSTGIFTDTEIGLHTFGNNSTSVYFDDFGLQTDVPTPAGTSEGFLPAVQQ